MNITIIGSGYVGLVTGACLADLGHKITCIDNDQKKLRILRNSQIPFYEPQLEELVKRSTKNKRLNFSSSFKIGCLNQIIFLCVDTPLGKDGSPNLTNLNKVVKLLGASIRSDTLIITKSTIPIGTNKKILLRLNQLVKHQSKLDICSNPEFLKEGSAVNDFMRPDRIIIGAEDQEVFNKMALLYAPINRKSNKIIEMSLESAELTKYAANAFLATKISFINKIAQVAEGVGANIHEVRQGIGADSRIGKEFLYAGLGFGGSCFPKDISALIEVEKNLGIRNSILQLTKKANDDQLTFFIKKIKKFYKQELKHKKLMIWGLSFKPNTDDVRDSIAIKLIQTLATQVKELKLFDPAAMPNAKLALKPIKNIVFMKHQYDAIEQCDALIICTEWKAFWDPESALIESLRDKVIFDGRNILNSQEISKLDIQYHGIGI